MRDESLLQIERNIARCRLIFSVVAPLAIRTFRARTAD